MKSVIERRMDIVSLVNAQNSARVDDLATQFGVSAVTIRNDLNFLEQNGYILRSHGVAMPNKGLIAELSNSEKRQRNSGIKQKIGAAAMKFIHDNDAIILDSGTTTREIANHLKQSSRDNVLVMTNGLDIATELAKAANTEVLMTGGRLRKNALSFSGRQAEMSLQEHCFSKFFLGVDGFDLRAGITTHNEQEANLNRAMCDVSNHVVAVTDSSKFGKQSCHVIRRAFEIDTLITDSGIPDEYVSALQDNGVEVIIVD
ncbi:DeoR/GlpR family DNA-binding transcription regulator [Pasteurellaceae bacterium TAE3-ERU1]|nr:DeoR/GlpR family DNA-binding transcription regulator [Pasteurellaceae bacterium TAE3-ERU1]